MQEHHIQKNILYALVISDRVRFADLKPDGIDSNVFTYHLKQLIKERLITKCDDGMYELTPLGRVAGINITLSKKELLEQAHSILLMCMRTPEEGWLLRKRLAQPMYNRVGFVHGEPVANEDAVMTAKRSFLERTGLEADFTPIGTGYVRLYVGDDLESFTHFTLLYADSYTGELVANMRNGQNMWLPSPDFHDKDMIPSMPDLVDLINKPDRLFYADLRYQI